MERKENIVVEKVYDLIVSEQLIRMGREYTIMSAYLYLCDEKFIVKDFELYEYAKRIYEYIKPESVTNIIDLYKTFSVEEIESIIIEAICGDSFKDNKLFDDNSTDDLNCLVFKLLDIQNGDKLYDLGSGNGNFLLSSLMKAKNDNKELQEIYGTELNFETGYLSKIALNIIDKEIKNNILLGNGLFKNNFKYSKGFTFPPFGVRQVTNEKEYFSKIFPDTIINNRNSSEWIFIDTLLNGLEGENQRAVAFVPGRALFNYADKDYRMKMIDSKKIEGVIALPSGVLPNTGINLYIIVFSNNNEYIKFVDFSQTDFTSKKGRNVKLDVEQIYNAYMSENVFKKRFDEISSEGTLIPANVIFDISDKIKGTPLCELAEVFTGNQYTVKNFEKIFSNETTGYKILTSSDINDGIIEWNNLQAIDYKDDKFDKYAVKKNDVIITSKSSKVKVAVVDIEPKEKIIVTGGMIIVRPDTTKLNPTYLKMFLDSEDGVKALKFFQKGITIVTITSRDLGKILIPDLKIEEQNKKSLKYNDLLSSMYMYKLEIKKIENSLKNLYRVESEEN